MCFFLYTFVRKVIIKISMLKFISDLVTQAYVRLQILSD